jgi:hypothetical protein
MAAGGSNTNLSELNQLLMIQSGMILKEPQQQQQPIIISSNLGK